MTPKLPFTPTAAVLDLDGLLIDSEGLWGEAEREVVTSLGRTWDPATQRLLLGKGPTDAARTLADHLGDVDAEEVDRRLQAASEARFRDGVPLRPGAERLVRGLAKAIPIAVATNSRRVLADLALASSGISDVIAAVVAQEDVEHPKPAPDPYELACDLLEVDPARAVAFEDSPVGVASAVAAGLWVIGCPSFDGERLERAHAVVSSLEALDPVALLNATR